MLTQCVRMTGKKKFEFEKKNLLIASKAPQCRGGAPGQDEGALPLHRKLLQEPDGRGMAQVCQIPQIPQKPPNMEFLAAAIPGQAPGRRGLHRPVCRSVGSPREGRP